MTRRHRWILDFRTSELVQLLFSAFPAVIGLFAIGLATLVAVVRALLIFLRA